MSPDAEKKEMYEKERGVGNLHLHLSPLGCFLGGQRHLEAEEAMAEY